ncbi:alpha/beta hydrolase [Arcanobacterium haemolyticum]|nr:alpha/beta hydrolase [Arcanobacterium haemolyticum]
MTWQPDFLDGYEQLTLGLHGDDEGPSFVTLVRPSADTWARQAADPATNQASHDHASPSFVVLLIHGWNDYFYHTELARHIALSGGIAYGIDLHKYGRSLREWQTFGYTTNLEDYDEDLHAALGAVYEEHGAEIPVILYGHSTGGLIAALWADRHPSILAGLILNSPWLELQSSTAMREVGGAILSRLARYSPTAILPIGDNGFYQRILTAGRDDGQTTIPGAPKDSDDPFWTTGWNPDPRFRVFPSWPTRVGWLAAIMRGQTRVAAGLHIDCPILVLTSARSETSTQWTENYRAADGVLDVEKIWKRVPGLGAHTTLVKLENAIHDVTFSRREVRNEAFTQIGAFLRAYCEL